jgi:hypothetical protein
MNKFNVETIFLNFYIFVKKKKSYILEHIKDIVIKVLCYFFSYNNNRGVFFTIKWIYLFFIQSNGFHLPLILIEIYEARIRDTIPIQYDTDTGNFLKFPIRYGRDMLFKNKFKIRYTNTQYINITKIEKDKKLTFKLLKLTKQVTITYLKLIKYSQKG